MGAVKGLDHAQGGPLSMRAGGRLQRHPIHANHGAQGVLETPHELECPLDRLLVLIRMDGCETGQSRGRLVGDRVVLHRAAAQWVELLADRVVHGGELAVVAHDLGLAGPRRRGRPRAQHLGRKTPVQLLRSDVRFGQARRMRVGPALLEAERLGHELTAATSSSIARGSLTSVQVNVRTPLSSRNQRLTSSPPRMPWRASFRLTTEGFGTPIGNSLRNGRSGKASSHPGKAASLSASAWARLKLPSATRRMPSSPMQVMYTLAASAQSEWLVQMLEVAFSRRMGRSRAASVSAHP